MQVINTHLSVLIVANLLKQFSFLQLKERLNVLEHGSSYQATKYTNSHKNSESLLENISENMTQDSGLIGEDDTEAIALVGLNCEINNSEVNLLDVGARHDFNILNEETNTENNSANPHTNRMYF